MVSGQKQQGYVDQHFLVFLFAKKRADGSKKYKADQNAGGTMVNKKKHNGIKQTRTTPNSSIFLHQTLYYDWPKYPEGIVASFPRVDNMQKRQPCLNLRITIPPDQEQPVLYNNFRFFKTWWWCSVGVEQRTAAFVTFSCVVHFHQRLRTVTGTVSTQVRRFWQYFTLAHLFGIFFNTGYRVGLTVECLSLQLSVLVDYPTNQNNFYISL